MICITTAIARAGSGAVMKTKRASGVAPSISAACSGVCARKSKGSFPKTGRDGQTTRSPD